MNCLGYILPEQTLQSDNISQWNFVKSCLLRFVYQRQKLSQYSSLEDAVELISSSKKILILTGAGISISCGIPDFRSKNGLYSRIQSEYGLEEPECMFDIEFFKVDPAPFFSLVKVPIS